MSLINHNELKRQIQTGEFTSLNNITDDKKTSYVRLFKLPAKRNCQAILAIKNTVSVPKTILIILTIAMDTTKRH